MVIHILAFKLEKELLTDETTVNRELATQLRAQLNHSVCPMHLG